MDEIRDDSEREMKLVTNETADESVELKRGTGEDVPDDTDCTNVD